MSQKTEETAIPVRKNASSIKVDRQADGESPSDDPEQPSSSHRSAEQRALRDSQARERELRAEAQAARERLAGVLTGISDQFVALDHDWRYVYVNDRVVEVTGRRREELLGASVWELFPEIIGTDLDRELRRAAAEQTAVRFEYFFPPWKRWFEVRVYPSSSGLTLFIADITERKQIEVLAAAEMKVLKLIAGDAPLRQVLDTLARDTEAQSAQGMLCSVLLADESGQHLLHGTAPSLPDAYNAAIHGVGIGPGVGSCGTAAHERRPVFVTDIATDPRWKDFRDLAAAHRLGACCSTPILSSRGDLLGTIAMYYRQAHDPGAHDRQLIERATQLAAIVIERKRADEILRDTSARLEVALVASKRAEEALREADRRKDEFIATLSHELRNPLAPLRNSLHLLRLAGERKTLTDAATAKIHRMMERQVDHLVRMVDDLLEISRISRGTFELRRERIELAAIVRSAVETSDPLIQSAGHRLSVSLPEEPLWVDGDPVRLAQILANLLNNAAKYTDRGGQISIEARRAGGAVTIAVRDNGSGIAPEALPRLFEMFNRGERSDRRGEGGLGIGLALAHRLAQMHGGSIDARSEGPGKGSEFTLRIPVAADQSSDPARERRIIEAPLLQKRILIIDDNRDAADSLSMILTLLGADVRVAGDGREGLELFRAYDPAVVLLDIGMPGLDGYEVAQRIRRDFPERSPIMVALTGWGQTEDLRQAQAAGFDHHMTKPAEIGALQALLMSLED